MNPATATAYVQMNDVIMMQYVLLHVAELNMDVNHEELSTMTQVLSTY